MLIEAKRRETPAERECLGAKIKPRLKEPIFKNWGWMVKGQHLKSTS